MKVKKYRALSLREASQLMKDELGGEAIILSTRLIEADPSIGQRKMFEISAGIEEPMVDDEVQVQANPKLEINPPKSFVDEMQILTEKIAKNKNSNNGNGSLNKTGGTHQSAKVMSVLKDEINLIGEKLKHNDISDHIVSSVIEQLKKSEEVLDESNINNFVLSNISSMISTAEFEIEKKSGSQRVAFVGPTGVGKTTCIAKLATISKILHNLDVGIISIDTYRLGAIDQLRIFSEIVDIDLLVAYEPEEMPALLKKFKSKDIIFIDTAGRSQKNTEHLQKMKEFLDAAKPDSTHLVLSSTSTTRTLYDVADKFDLFNYDSMVFTKIDEAVVYGSMLNVSANFNKPIMYLTNGQVIPDDIISAEPDFIANMIYSGKYN
ncbi:MAG: flagellar biosynthesis protein FlhF [Ignavibacteriae bacterium]|nr:flagellar biosynthesis protein FlhF [Ignavibacteriota bacterium]NOG97154.1 flagellar biosynthesis protein FlhF [Ignavibacteriota bacterium]